MALIPDNYFKCVFPIGTKPDSDWIATGFLCIKTIAGRNYNFIVTNNHVVENKTEIYIRLYNKNDKEYRGILLTLRDKKGDLQYSAHPDKDVVAITLNGKLLEESGFKWAGFDVETGMMSSTDYYAEGGDVGARVFMIGFPMGLVDINKNDPICRGGYIARKEENGYLLDIQNFPGNSGSPIISCPEALTVPGTTAMKTCALIGMVSSYIPYQKELIDVQTKRPVEIRDENSGLANACNVEVIREVIDMELKRLGIGILKNEGNSPNSFLPQ